MQTKDLAPLLLDVCIDCLELRPVGTKYHPYKNEYVVDARVLARIIRHGGALNARLTQSENVFFSQMLQALIELKTIPSNLHIGKYYAEELNGYSRLVIRVKKLGLFRRHEGFNTNVEYDENEVETKEDKPWVSQTV